MSVHRAVATRFATAADEAPFRDHLLKSGTPPDVATAGARIVCYGLRGSDSIEFAMQCDDEWRKFMASQT